MRPQIFRHSLLAALVLTVAGCASMTGDRDAPGDMNASIDFLALGDSYTIGESVEPEERWPVQLTQALREAGYAVDVPRIVARTGWTTGELSAAMDEQTFDPPYGLVSLLIGVNNQYRGHEVERFETEFRALLERAVELAGGRRDRVIVVSIPDWGVTPFAARDERSPAAIGDQIDRYNAAKERVTRAMGIRFVDITDLSRADDPSLVAGDGLHPSGKQYSLWVERILPVVRDAL